MRQRSVRSVNIVGKDVKNRPCLGTCGKWFVTDMANRICDSCRKTVAGQTGFRTGCEPLNLGRRI